MPSYITMTPAKNEAYSRMMTLAGSPMPKYTITSGMSAMGGSTRKKLIKGSMKRRTPGYQPRTKPTGTARAMPQATPMKTRWVDIQTSRGRRPWLSNSHARSATACGVGTRAGLTRPE